MLTESTDSSSAVRNCEALVTANSEQSPLVAHTVQPAAEITNAYRDNRRFQMESRGE